MNPYEIDYDNWAEKKPHGYSGCFRLRNESQFMEAAVLSHLPYLDEAVLVTQPSSDRTEAIAQELGRQFPDKIRVCHYPYIVDWTDTQGFYDGDPDKIGHLVHMSNWALSQCRYSWIVKPEGDVVALPSFQGLIDWIELHPDERHYYGWVLLNIAGPNKTLISLDNPRNGGWDTAAFPNHPDYHYEKVQKWGMIRPPGPKTCFGLRGLHMKRCKFEYAHGFNDETYVPLTRGIVDEVMQGFNQSRGYPGDSWERDLDNNWEDLMELLANLPRMMTVDLS